MVSSTQTAWTAIQERFQVREALVAKGVCELTADQIKSAGRREPRLMTKFDTRESRPAALRDVTILPLSNGRYALLHGDGYANLAEHRITTVDWSARAVPHQMLTLPFARGPASEAQALDMALASGLLQHFIEDESVRLTIRGRLRSPRFTFWFQTERGAIELAADGVQIEVDSGLEGDAIHLIEAKLGTRNNFHLRQLYYPLRMWRTLIAEKPVRALFLSFSNRKYQLRQYAFDPEDRLQAPVLVKARDYLLDPLETLPSIEDALASSKRGGLPELPFPQADDMRKVIDIVDAVSAGVGERRLIARRYDFEERQADYYGNAATFLGLLERSRGGFELSRLGQRFALGRRAERHALLIKRLAELPVFREVLEYLVERKAPPPVELASEWVARETALADSTQRRRALTVIAWASWADARTRQLEMTSLDRVD